MRSLPKPVSNHRLARLIVCARALIVWAAAVFFESLFANRRRIRQRYRMLSIDKLTHLVRNLMIARVAQLARRNPSRHCRFDDARPGFRRRARTGNLLRSIAGSRLRRFLDAGDVAARFALLIRILANLDAYVRPLLLRRALRGINRLTAVVAVRPPHDALRTLAAPFPALADSS
jgi:hypothetical protein